LSVFTGAAIPELENEYAGKGYGDLKGDLADAFSAFVTPLQAQVSVYLDDPGELDKVLVLGAVRAREVADQTVATVYERIGLLGG
jgi:tryptophanyl-tRNA synthetase